MLDCQGRESLKSVLRKCVTCRRYQERPLLPPETPGLLDYRVKTLCTFQCTGLDCVEPLFTKNNQTLHVHEKSLFCWCASSRALHLELTPNMKALAFIKAFERFTARRGTPDVIINYNFKTFKSSINLCCALEFDRNSYYHTLVGWVLRETSEISENVIKKDSCKINVKLWRTRDCFAQNWISYKWMPIRPQFLNTLFSVTDLWNEMWNAGIIHHALFWNGSNSLPCAYFVNNGLQTSSMNRSFLNIIYKMVQILQ